MRDISGEEMRWRCGSLETWCLLWTGACKDAMTHLLLPSMIAREVVYIDFLGIRYDYALGRSRSRQTHHTVHACPTATMALYTAFAVLLVHIQTREVSWQGPAINHISIGHQKRSPWPLLLQKELPIYRLILWGPAWVILNNAVSQGIVHWCCCSVVLPHSKSSISPIPASWALKFHILILDGLSLSMPSW